jgi:hypothetical protein
VPADPDLIRKWLDTRAPRVKPAGALSIDEINEEVLASIERGEGEASEEYAMLVFQRLDNALMLRTATIRAHYKDCAYQLSGQFIGRIERERTFNTRVKNGVYVDEGDHVGIHGTKFLPLLRPDGSRIAAPDGAYDKAIHVRGPKGTVNALKRIEFVEPPSMLEFRLKVLGRSISNGSASLVQCGLQLRRRARDGGVDTYDLEQVLLDPAHRRYARHDDSREFGQMFTRSDRSHRTAKANRWHVDRAEGDQGTRDRCAAIPQMIGKYGEVGLQCAEPRGNVSLVLGLPSQPAPRELAKLTSGVPRSCR